MDPKIFFVAAKHGAYPAGRLTFEGFIFKLITCTALHFDEAGDCFVVLIKPILVSLALETNCFLNNRRYCVMKSNPSTSTEALDGSPFHLGSYQ